MAELLPNTAMLVNRFSFAAKDASRWPMSSGGGLQGAGAGRLVRFRHGFHFVIIVEINIRPEIFNSWMPAHRG
jgi:hypothetical protein